jgi:WD40-like Beta Propeller Repeat
MRRNPLAVVFAIACRGSVPVPRRCSAVLASLVLLAFPTLMGCSAAGHAAAGAGPALRAVPAAARSASGSSRLEPGRGYPAAFVASVSRDSGMVSRGLAVFSSKDGHLARWLVRSARSPVPVAVSPDNRWVYYYNQAAPLRGRCPRNGFTEPALLRISARGGRAQRAGIRTTSIAFSPDGRMVAYTSARHCGSVVWIIVHDRQAGTTRRILLARNAPTSNNPIFSARLSWAPDDRRLAVAVWPAAAINVISVIDARRAVRMPAHAIRPCNGQNDECLDPAFDLRGRLTFLKWLNKTGSFSEWVVRWQKGSAIRLIRLSRNQSAGYSASIAVDRAGNAILLEGGLRQHEIWRWSGGHFALILGGSRRQLVTSPLWLRRNPR